MRKRLWAAVLSLFIPGVGQLYSGRVKKAIVIYGLYALLGGALYSGLLGRSFASLVALTASLLALQVTAAVHAAVTPSRTAAEPRRWFITWYGSLAVFVVLAVAQGLGLDQVKSIKTFVHQSASMEPSIRRGERLMAALDACSERDPRRGEIVIFASPDQSGAAKLKRVVAVGGDTLEIRAKELIVNGLPAVEPWAVHRHDRVFPPADPPTRRRSLPGATTWRRTRSPPATSSSSATTGTTATTAASSARSPDPPSSARRSTSTGPPISRGSAGSSRHNRPLRLFRACVTVSVELGRLVRTKSASTSSS